MLISFLENIGSRVLDMLYFVGDMTLLLIGTLKQLPRRFRGRQLLREILKEAYDFDEIR